MVLSLFGSYVKILIHPHNHVVIRDQRIFFVWVVVLDYLLQVFLLLLFLLLHPRCLFRRHYFEFLDSQRQR